jgi:hypothetical protein
MDLAKLKRSITPWATLVANWHKGKQIDRNEVIRLLESGKSIPLEANEFLAKALANKTYDTHRVLQIPTLKLDAHRGSDPIIDFRTI